MKGNVLLFPEETFNLHNESGGNITTEDFLLDWNDEVAKRFYGRVVFLSIMIIMGIIGNIHVLYISIFKFKRTKRRIYFIWIAVVDMTACVVVLPYKVYTGTYPVMFSHGFVCSFLEFLYYFLAGGSSMLLLVIAVDRYRMICQPLRRQLTKIQLNCACALMLTITISVCSPVAYFSREETVFNETFNITGQRCNIKRDLRSQFQYYEMFLAFVVISHVSFIAIMYIYSYLEL